MMSVSINLVCHFKEGSSSLICRFTAIWLLSAGFFDTRGGPNFSFEGWKVAIVSFSITL